MEISMYFISKEIFQYPFDGRLGGPQIYSGFGVKEKNPAPAGNQTQMIQSFANNLTEYTIPTHICMYIEA
jgi:hypothetical protein